MAAQMIYGAGPCHHSPRPACISFPALRLDFSGIVISQMQRTAHSHAGPLPYQTDHGGKRLSVDHDVVVDKPEISSLRILESVLQADVVSPCISQVGPHTNKNQLFLSDGD